MERRVKNRLHHGITTGLAFEEWEAARDAGIPLDRWDAGHPSFKARVIAWHRLRSAIAAHVADAQIEYQQWEARKAAAKSKNRNRRSR